MILKFPDFDSFRLVVASGMVPTSLSSATAYVAQGSDCAMSLRTSKKLSQKTLDTLAKLRIEPIDKPLGNETEATCWPQILPLIPEPGPQNLSLQAPVLFELDNHHDLPLLVNEMLRLGNDRQSVQWLTATDGSIDRVLLRVIAPPYYTLLRALDPSMSGTQGAVRVYHEQAARIWVQMGYRHELANELRLPDGQILLIRHPREWETVKDEPFDDIYGHLDFELPLSPQHWSADAKPDKMEIPLRLVDGNAADVAELWVIREDAKGRLDAFVRDADDRLVQRLKFAVATDSTNRTVIVLRVSTSQIAPPVLAWENVLGFRPYHKLPNLYVPVGMRLHPTLRRDAVRELLADDPDQLVWLYPSASNNLSPLAPGGEGLGVRGLLSPLAPGGEGPGVRGKASPHSYEHPDLAGSSPSPPAPLSPRPLSPRGEGRKKPPHPRPLSPKGARGEKGTFTPERIPEDAFRPLEDWVEYVIADHAETLTQWIESTRFHFDSFICKEGQSPGKPKPDEPSRKPRQRGDGLEQDDAGQLSTQVSFVKPGDGDASQEMMAETVLEPMGAKPIDVLKQQRDQLEARFLEIDEPLDSPAHVALWPALARANQAMDDLGESSLCWLNALWIDDAPTADWVQEWLTAHQPKLKPANRKRSFSACSYKRNRRPARCACSACCCSAKRRGRRCRVG